MIAREGANVQSLTTSRLVLIPITISVVEAMLDGRRQDAERMVDAKLPEAWPGVTLVEQAFSVSLSAIRESPDARLWGDRVIVTRSLPRRVIGSVVFHGAPGSDGIVEMAYGVEAGAQGQGYATEATASCLQWALAEPTVRLVRATTPPWHRASQRVLTKIGMRLVRMALHDVFGEVCEYEADASSD